MPDDLPQKETQPTAAEKAVDPEFFLIAMGASAGGLDAIKQVLSRVPHDYPHSLVIIQHISPDYKSLMPEILGRESSLTVREVEHGMPVEPGHIYLAPPRSNVVIQGTDADTSLPHRAPLLPGTHERNLHFALAPQVPRPGLNLPIDLFFASLAEAVRSRAIGVVLSGTGSDGSRGILSIKDLDGFVVVQDPASADFDGMPRSAIATNAIDMVLPSDEIIPEINRYIAYRKTGQLHSDEVTEEDRHVVRDIVDLVSAQSEIDFALYKLPTLQRRVMRRARLRGHPALTDYYEELRNTPAEVDILSREFLIGVTNFFRDLPVWQTLSETVIPRLYATGPADEPLRVWCAGCSTGEEAFTLAMLLEDYRQRNNITRDFRVYASDVNETTLKIAKRATYPDSVRDEIPEAFVDAGYVTIEGGVIEVADILRKKVIFSLHDIVSDPPFTQTDLITCRNLLIYLSPDVQTKVIAQFSYSLRKEGVLVLGAAETPGPHGVVFRAINQKLRIYNNSRQPGEGRSKMSLSEAFELTANQPSRLPRSRRMHLSGPNAQQPDIAQLLQTVTTEQDLVICIVDEGARILRTFGNVTGFLSFAADGFSTHLLDLIEDTLRSPVMLTLRRAETDGRAIRENIRVGTGDDRRLVDVVTRKIDWPPEGSAYAVLFSTRSHVPDIETSVAPVTDSGPQGERIALLEAEIASLQDMLSATAEDLGASNEALQSANEELTATNEELQANNEETQSINEELHTVNAEHAERIVELESATVDIENLLGMADLGLLVLDKDLRVRRFSAGLAPFMQLSNRDKGRPFLQLATNLPSAEMDLLVDDARIAVESGEQSGRELRRRDGGWVRTVVRPYTSADRTPRGAIVTFADVTSLKLLETDVRAYRSRLSNIVESPSGGFFEWQEADGHLTLSPALRTAMGLGQTPAGGLFDALKRCIPPGSFARLRADVSAHLDAAARRNLPLTLEVPLIAPTGQRQWWRVTGHVTGWTDRPYRPAGISGQIFDITAAKRAEVRSNAALTLNRGHALADLFELSETTQAAAGNTKMARVIEDGLHRLDMSQDRLTATSQALSDTAERIAAMNTLSVSIAPLPRALVIPAFFETVLVQLLTCLPLVQSAEAGLLIFPDAGIRIVEQPTSVPGQVAISVLRADTPAFSDTGMTAEDSQLVDDLFAMCQRLVRLQGGCLTRNDAGFDLVLKAPSADGPAPAPTSDLPGASS